MDNVQRSSDVDLLQEGELQVQLLLFLSEELCLPWLCMVGESLQMHPGLGFQESLPFLQQVSVCIYIYCFSHCCREVFYVFLYATDWENIEILSNVFCVLSWSS